MSPHDPRASYARKLGKTEWIGYKDHQSETCDDDAPHLIVNVVTTPATEQDWDVLPRIHESLDAQGMAPADLGYAAARHAGPRAPGESAWPSPQACSCSHSAFTRSTAASN